MGIKCTEEIVCKSQDEFHAIDRIVTGFAFDIHNEYGRFCDEKIYQEILAQKCYQSAIEAKREVEISLSYKNFRKTYKIDLLVDNGVIYELKAVKALNGAHKQQLINYLLLLGIRHGKLLNFGAASVECEFVSTSLSIKERYEFSVNDTKWENATSRCSDFKELLIGLLQEWGLFLDRALYQEAMIHFLGDKTLTPVEIHYNGEVVGTQKIALLDSKTAFHISTIPTATRGYEKNIERLIKNTKIKTIQWVNLNHHKIQFKTIHSY